MRDTPRARLIAYGVAVLATAISLLVRWPLWPVLETRAAHMTFFPAVMLAAYYGGLTYAEVSRRLAANLSTIKSRIRDALRGLRNCLDAS